MVRITGMVERQTNAVAEVVPSVRTYDVTTKVMADDCIPHSIAQKAVLWLTREGVLAEIECIYPYEVETSLCMVSDAVSVVIGCPILEPGEEGPLWVEPHGTSFTIWLAEGKVVDREYVMANNLKLLASESQLVGVAVASIHIVMYAPVRGHPTSR